MQFRVAMEIHSPDYLEISFLRRHNTPQGILFGSEAFLIVLELTEDIC